MIFPIKFAVIRRINMKTITSRFVNFFLIVILFQFPLSTAQAVSTAMVQKSSTVVIAGDSTIAALYNTNLVPDGDAEVTNYSPYWHDNEGFTQILSYGSSCGGMCNFPSPYDNGPAQRGTHFWYMGTTSNHTNGNNLWLNNKIALAPIQSAINSGRVGYILSGYFGGDTNLPATSQLQMFFENGSGSSTGNSIIVGNVTPADRGNKTGLLYRQMTGYVPTGTQFINLAVQTGAINPIPNDYRTGFADNLSLVLIPIKTFLPVIDNKRPDQVPPSTGFPAPTGVYVAPNGLTRMDIYWTDNSTNELGFEVQRINQNASVDTICNTKPNVTYCFDPGISQGAPYGYIYLGNNTTYTYQVRAVGEGINSNWTNGTGTTETEPLTPPSPTNGSFTCQAIDVTSTSATFVWNEPFNYEAGFNLYLGSNPYPSYTMLERGTKITFINQSPGSITLKMIPFVFDRTNPAVIHESSTSCTTTAILNSPPTSGIARFYNNASYPVISLLVDGWEQFPVRPLSILPGSYYELYNVPSGQHIWTAITGFWNDWGTRFTMYTYTGQFTQPATGSKDITIPDMTIQDLLTVPPANPGYWEGYYFDASSNCWTTAFKFYQNGTYTFYNANSPVDSGTYSLVQRQSAIFSTKFHVSGNQNVDGLLIETHGQFFMNNGPASWPQITYVYKPQGYIYNPFCP
jgi:hypothetical protein